MCLGKKNESKSILDIVTWKPSGVPRSMRSQGIPCPQMPTVTGAVCLDGSLDGTYSQEALTPTLQVPAQLHSPLKEGIWFLDKPSGEHLTRLKVLSLYLNCTQGWALCFRAALELHA